MQKILDLSIQYRYNPFYNPYNHFRPVWTTSNPSVLDQFQTFFLDLLWTKISSVHPFQGTWRGDAVFTYGLRKILRLLGFSAQTRWPRGRQTIKMLFLDHVPPLSKKEMIWSNTSQCIIWLISKPFMADEKRAQSAHNNLSPLPCMKAGNSNQDVCILHQENI